MDYLVQNATEIMQLCFGFGFLILVLFLVRSIYITTQILKKVNDLTDLFIEYIQKPISMILSAEKMISKGLEFFKK